MKNYEDIINLPHHTSSTRQRMNISDRAAQFAPFAALSGYDSVIEETARQTDRQDEACDDDTALLNKKLVMLKEHCAGHPYIEINYFIPDERKDGGRYDTVYGYLKTVNEIERKILLRDNREIAFDKIRSIDSTIFNELFLS